MRQWLIGLCVLMGLGNVAQASDALQLGLKPIMSAVPSVTAPAAMETACYPCIWATIPTPRW